MRMQLWAASCAVLLAACSTASPTDGQSQGGSGGGGSTQSSSATGNAKPTLVGDWVFKLQTGKDEINMSSTTTGHAQLYWYDSGEAQWQVSAKDDGVGSATLTLTCASADCATADDIVYDCTYNLIALKCIGVSGGLMNNYKGNSLNMTKQG